MVGIEGDKNVGVGIQILQSIEPTEDRKKLVCEFLCFNIVEEKTYGSGTY
jgi:hypothetical protein